MNFKNLKHRDPEQVKIKKWLRHLRASSSSEFKVLDVGCGYGRNLEWLVAEKFDVLGVETNETIVKRNRDRGLPCISVSDFEKSNAEFDILLMSHIVEHFLPADLLKFMDFYLSRLKPQGHLVIATPLLSPYFYDDFDHIKPYQPTGFMMVFGGEGAQVQYYSRHRLKLVDLWFRRTYYQLHLVRGQYLRTLTRPLIFLTNLASALVATLTCGLIARMDGWVGLFQKG